MIYQVIQHVHLIRRYIVEGYGIVRTAVKALRETFVMIIISPKEDEKIIPHLFYSKCISSTRTFYLYGKVSNDVQAQKGKTDPVRWHL